MLPDLPRTLLTPLPFPLQSSLLPQHLMLPSPLHLSQLAPLPLTLLSSRESLLPSELTPESPLSSPTLSHRSMSRSTMLMSQLLSHVPFPVRSSRSPMSPSLMRLLSHMLSQLPLMPDMLMPDTLLLDTLLLPDMLVWDMLLLPSELLMLPVVIEDPPQFQNQPNTCSLLNLFLFRRLIFIEFLWFSHVDPFHFDPGETSRTLLFCDAQTCNI